MSFRARRVLAAVVAATVGGVLGMGPTLSSAADMTEQQMADLAYLEERDSIFPDIDPGLWAKRPEAR